MAQQMALNEQLVRDGFYIFPNVLDTGMLLRLRAATNALLDSQSEEQQRRQRSTGSMIPLSKTDDPIFAELITWRAALDALQ